ncbi:MAG: RNA polymerase sigma factor [Acidimicrobiia bacterium]|nr:RNA polymerase sigma factor [Acidimicrobiia bacterium]
MNEPIKPIDESASTATFETLYERLLPVVYGYFLRRVGGDVALAEDLTQETFLSAVKTMPGTLASPEAWIITVARRRLVDHIRHKNRRPRTVSRDVDVASPGWPPDWSVDERRLVVALSRLASSQRLVLILHYVDGFSVREVAQRVGRSVVATESLLARGRRALRSRFEEVTDE